VIFLTALYLHPSTFFIKDIHLRANTYPCVVYSRYEDNLTDPTRDFEFSQLIATDLIL